ncbi:MULTISPECIES: tyrosine-type recombinase/integrase [Aliarcobacter]|uniref:Site-specific integrase n=2 Tax=Aliarcobacter skirrowii TaxID=28200 RepID=A0AAD0SKU2_9BACT|nr:MULTISPECIES: site-specific integrase [Aliarcobacter]AXX84576.1 site-specific tyrosine recombinase, phage integrase family (INT_Rci_Hp1_C domain) [Aliarcobacter skirrowii CCUG 10374]KAB0619915.1 site-specific integrase [Aliarcobacter skirrowii CCUG 10374]MDX4069839.1 site-specific integrase [Aliarcobacter skirrowii]OCL85974.1 site-specific tyrosine recombinase XerC [Aliarcobacter thereius]RXI24739.1 site-specific integrase [Aliarcobacter skirrowii CCUG 10374]
MTKTRLTGIYFREIITNDKTDKVYYITYKDENNKKIWIKIGKYSEGIRETYCNQKRNEILTKQRNGEEAPVIAARKKKQILSIEYLAESYFKEKNISGSTLNHYKVHVLPYFKNYDIDLLDKKDIEKYKHFLNQKITINTKKPLAPKTINNILNILKTIGKYSLKNDLLKNDFTKYITTCNIDNARERFLTKDEIQILYNETKEDNIIYLFFKLALNTGARLATILNIHKKDIDFAHNLITLKDFKNNSTYKSFLTDDLKHLLELRTANLSLNDKIFTTNPEKRLRAILDELFNEGIDNSDRKNKVVIHTLRHTFASHLAINGTPIFTIQKLMNHKDIKMTMRYAKLAPDSGREAVINLGL